MSNTTPPKSLRSRMGTAMRRTSSVLAFSRPSTPGASPKQSQGAGGRARSSSVTTSESDTSSVSRPSVDTSAPTIPPISTPSAIQMPSPIAESPAREAAATADEIREELRELKEPKAGPTPLTQVVTAPSAQALEEAPSQAPSSTGPALIGSANEPHVFTEEPDEMSLRAHTIESSKESAPIEKQTQNVPAPVAPAGPSVSEVSPAPGLETAPSYFEIPPHPPSESSLSDSKSLRRAILENTMGVVEQEQTPGEIPSDQTTPRPHGPADTENASVFFAFSDMPVPATNEVKAEDSLKPAPSMPEPTVEPVPVPGPAPPTAEVVQMPLPDIADEGSVPPPVGPSASQPIPIPSKRQDIDTQPDQPSTYTYTDDVLSQPAAYVPKDKKVENAASSNIVPYDIGSNEEVWASRANMQKDRDAVGRQHVDNSLQTLQDPFADPVPSIHPSTIGTIGLSGMPEYSQISVIMSIETN
ncbi:hypothetical protein C8R42DRAFT_193084 [Lentinula raphanica]|nr:hypothetical protein C8R42DRAFT_193084 [Lentinula raphanica]